MKIVLNKRFGGYHLSEGVYSKLRALYWIDKKQADFLPRTDERLINAVELCEKEGTAGALRVVEFPDDMDWDIFDYDGMEYVYDKHRFF